MISLTILITIFWLIILVRSLVIFFETRNMIDFYYEHHSGWDKHQCSIFVAYPLSEPLKLVFRLDIWSLSKVYPEFYNFKKGKPV